MKICLKPGKKSWNATSDQKKFSMSWNSSLLVLNYQQTLTCIWRGINVLIPSCSRDVVLCLDIDWEWNSISGFKTPRNTKLAMTYIQSIRGRGARNLIRVHFWKYHQHLVSKNKRFARSLTAPTGGCFNLHYSEMSFHDMRKVPVIQVQVHHFLIRLQPG